MRFADRLKRLNRHVQFTAGEYPHGVQAVSLAGKWESRLKPYVDAQLPFQNKEQPLSEQHFNRCKSQNRNASACRLWKATVKARTLPFSVTVFIRL